MTASSSKSPEVLEVAAGPVAGRVRVPSSKSLSQRYLNLALLARAPLVLERPLVSEDIELFLGALEVCGFDVTREEERLLLEPHGKSPARGTVLCGHNGTMLRFLTAALTTIAGSWRLDGSPRLRQRPVGPLVEALGQLGARVRYEGEAGFAPLAIEGASLAGGHAVLDAGESSQYLSALLQAALRARSRVTVEVTALASSPYLELTLGAVEAFGGQIEVVGPGGYSVAPRAIGAVRLRVDGDDSAACYPAAAAALTGGPVVLEGLNPRSRQGDRLFLALLEQMGARVERGEKQIVVRGGGGLRAVTADLSEMPDQVPTLAALAPFARGVTRIENVPHLRIKESDRLAAMAAELAKLGAEVEERPDGLTIPGVWADGVPRDLPPIEVETWGDHRIAMSLALVGLVRPGVRVRDPGVVAKSYPGFWRDLEALRQR